MLASAGCKQFHLGKICYKIQISLSPFNFIDNGINLMFRLLFMITVTGAWSNPESYFYIPRIKGQCEQEILKMNTNNPFQNTHEGDSISIVE